MICYGQNHYRLKSDIAFIKYGGRTIHIDPGPDWKGYYLNEGQDVIAISVVNGVQFKNFFFLGIGASYLNFQGVTGHAIFGEMEFISSKSGIRPMFAIRGGYNHINNQYENGTSTGIINFNTGFNYKVTPRLGLQLTAGLMFTQQSLLFPIQFGVNFK